MGDGSQENEFQSHAGSIEANSTRSGTTSNTAKGFQSHAGSIEAGWRLVEMDACCSGFNPTLVRLRRIVEALILSLAARFNPTLVRLRPRGRAPTRGGGIRFQSHAGSIEASPIPEARRPALSGFNPTLVRLRRCGGPGGPADVCVFQSHAGSIEAYGPLAFLARWGSVSIPRWFD